MAIVNIESKAAPLQRAESPFRVQAQRVGEWLSSFVAPGAAFTGQQYQEHQEDLNLRLSQTGSRGADLSKAMAARIRQSRI